MPKPEKKIAPSEPRNKREPITQVKGTRDILPKEYAEREKFIEKAKAIASFYGFKPMQTPHIESMELFTATLGETTDIVEKEMYTMKTKGGDKLVLRPEGTAPIMRAYIEHGMHTKPQPIMVLYYGSFFRHDKPQKGRRREFQQLGLEILGEKDSITDATIIKVFQAILEEAGGLKPLSVHINSVGCKECRKLYQRELIAFYKKKKICKDCERRLKTNPLRLLDCKEEQCKEIKKEAPQIISYLCDDCKNHFKELLEILDSSEIPYFLDHYLVRGLDYYTRTAFQFYVEGYDLELGGGGRYDGLSKIIGNKDVPAVGGAIGIDRILEAAKEKEVEKIKEHPKSSKIFFIQLGKEPKHKSLYILELLRKAKISVRHSLSKNSMKSQLKLADKLKIPYALILGQKEVLEDSIILRNMETASQETIPLSRLIDYLKKKM